MCFYKWPDTETSNPQIENQLCHLPKSFIPLSLRAEQGAYEHLFLINSNKKISLTYS